MERDLTEGSIISRLWLFALPLMLGNVLQQFYNLVDTWVVGRYIGSNALAAVGAAYTLMTFLNSVLLGLCLGSSSYCAIQYGKKDYDHLKKGIFISFILIGVLTIILNILVICKADVIIELLQVPQELHAMMYEYLLYIFFGMIAIFLYNYFSNLLRAVGNSVTPLIFLGGAVILNIVLDIMFVVKFNLGVKGAAIATVIAQYFSGVGLVIYYYAACPMLRVRKKHLVWEKDILREMISLSGLTCLQQSVMNFGILMVQGLVNSFGAATMAAFATAVKIDTVAYMPVQDFGNAFSTFVAQNHGAGKKERIQKGIKSSIICIFLFCLLISGIVCGLAKPLMMFFVGENNSEVIQIGVGYLRIEAACYFGIGLLFMLYGYYRAIQKPGMSVVLTVISLGTRVVLAYGLSSISQVGVRGIWVAIPIGWFLADLVGCCYYCRFTDARTKAIERVK